MSGDIIHSAAGAIAIEPAGFIAVMSYCGGEWVQIGTEIYADKDAALDAAENTLRACISIEGGKVVYTMPDKTIKCDGGKLPEPPKVRIAPESN